MSGYPRRGGTRGGYGGYGGYRGGYSGRDQRERSPDRGHERNYRDRSRDDRNPYHGGRGGRDQPFNQGRGRDMSDAPIESLSSLPSEVSIPSSGGRLDLVVPPSKGTLGRPVNLQVNHFVIQSLPTIRVRARRI